MKTVRLGVLTTGKTVRPTFGPGQPMFFQNRVGPGNRRLMLKPVILIDTAISDRVSVSVVMAKRLR